MYIKTDKVDLFGLVDYQGLDASKTVPGTHVYDFEHGVYAVEIVDGYAPPAIYQTITPEEYAALVESLMPEESEDEEC